MRALLHSLPVEQAIFLLVLLILGSDEDLELLRFLPQEESQNLQEAISQILQGAPKKQLLHKLVAELKFLLKSASNKSAAMTLDPAWYADFIVNEPPQTIPVLLRAFPPSSAERIIQALPPHIAQQIPRYQTHVEPEILKIARDYFDSLCPTLDHSNPSDISLQSICKLTRDEFFTLIRELGFKELAIAFRGAGRGPLTELCRRLGSEEAENLLNTIRRLPPSSPVEIKAAQRTIRAISFAHRAKSEIIQEAGMGMFISALQNVPIEYKKNLAYTLPRHIGEKILKGQPALISDEELLRLQHQLADTIILMAEEGRFPERWKGLEKNLPPLPSPDEEISQLPSLPNTEEQSSEEETE